MPMKKIMLSVTDKMYKALEVERKKRKLFNIPETVRFLFSLQKYGEGGRARNEL